MARAKKNDAPNIAETHERPRKPVLVTTAHRGVFFGYLIGDAAKEKVVLASARSVVYWDAAAKGFLGLASTGPTPGCRIGPAAGDESTVFDITGVFGCTPAAAAAFEAAPWSR